MTSTLSRPSRETADYLRIIGEIGTELDEAGEHVFDTGVIGSTSSTSLSGTC